LGVNEFPLTDMERQYLNAAAFVAQCTRKFADYVVSSNCLGGSYDGPLFVLSQSYSAPASAEQYLGLI
jgi:hypothetical protein